MFPRLLSVFLVLGVLLTGCIHSNENGAWDPRPIHQWRCPDSGVHGFVLDSSSQPISGVLVSFRPWEYGETEEAVDTDHSGAWEVCKVQGERPTITFEKVGYQKAVLRPNEHPGQHEFEIVLPED